jgi:hypothetical protein
MTHIPVDENDLIDVAIYIDMLNKKPVDNINPSQIKTKCLRLIFQGKTHEAMKEYDTNCF